MWSFLAKYSNFGLLLMRIGVGGMFLFHGFPKVLGGPDKWHKLGEAVRYVGIDSGITVAGALGAFSEFFGGLAVLVGFAYRPACLALTATMGVAVSMHLGKGEGILGASHALENALFFFAAMFVGPGSYSVDKR